MSVHLNGLRSSTLLGPATTQIASQKMKLLNLVSFITREICKYQWGYWSQSKRSVCHMAAPNLPELRIFSSKSPWASAPNKVVVFHCDLGIYIPLSANSYSNAFAGFFFIPSSPSQSPQSCNLQHEELVSWQYHLCCWTCLLLHTFHQQLVLELAPS